MKHQGPEAPARSPAARRGTRLGRRWIGWAFALQALACMAAPPAEFTAATRAAEAARLRGYPRLAAEQWDRAAQSADAPNDRDEARYRAAQMYLKAGDTPRARSRLRALAQKPAGARTARAAFELAYLERAQGHRAGIAELEACVKRFPDSGLTTRALRELARHYREEGDPLQAAERLKQFSTGRNRADELSRFLRAELLEAAGQTEAALTTYLELARRYPYPRGAYWDDAMLNAAAVAQQTHQYKRALSVLDELLARRESATWVGSYERRYAEAELARAKLLLGGSPGDQQHALERLEAIPSQYPTSRLRDDALWLAARVGRARGESERACRSLRRIAELTPESRYLSCFSWLCPCQGAANSATHCWVPAVKPCSNAIVHELSQPLVSASRQPDSAAR